MNKAKKYYIDEDGDMIGYPRRRSKKTEVEAIPFHAKLKITGIGWNNSGCYFALKDENGKHYNMNDIMLKDCIKKGKEIFIEGDWNFYQQGTAYSIGLGD